MRDWITKYVQSIGGWIVVAVLGGITATVSYNYWSANGHKPPPVHELIHTYVDPPTVRPNDDGILEFTLRTTSIRRERCPTNIYRTFSRIDTGEIVHSILAVGGLVPSTGKPVEFPMLIKIPAARMPPGEYGYTAFAINNCGEGRVYLANTEVAKFTVEAR